MAQPQQPQENRQDNRQDDKRENQDQRSGQKNTRPDHEQTDSDTRQADTDIRRPSERETETENGSPEAPYKKDIPDREVPDVRADLDTTRNSDRH